MNNQKSIITIIIITLAVVSVLSVGIGSVLMKYGPKLTNNSTGLLYNYKSAPPVVIQLPESEQYNGGEYYKNVIQHSWGKEKSFTHNQPNPTSKYYLSIRNGEYLSGDDKYSTLDLNSKPSPLALGSLASFQRYMHNAQQFDFIITESIEFHENDKLISLGANTLLLNNNILGVGMVQFNGTLNEAKTEFFSILDTVKLR